MEKINKETFEEKYNMSFYCGADPDEKGMQLMHDVLTWGRRYLLYDKEGKSKAKIGHYLDNCLVVTSPSDSNRILRCQYNTRRKVARELPKLEFTSHARKQMFLRGIDDEKVVRTLEFGKMIHYKDRKGNLRDACLLDNISVGATPSDNEEGVLVVVTVMRLSPISELNFINLCRDLKGRLGEQYRFSIVGLDNNNQIYEEWEGRSKKFENFQPERSKKYTFKFKWPQDPKEGPKNQTEEMSLFRRLGFEGSPETMEIPSEDVKHVHVEWDMSKYDLDCVWGWGRK